MSTITPVLPNSLLEAVAAVKSGSATLQVRTMARITVIDAKCLAKWENVSGAPLLREAGEGYRMRRGKQSVYLFPGQLLLVKE